MTRTVALITCLFFALTPIASPAQSGISDSRQLRMPSGTHSIPFEWIADSSQTPVEPHAAILIPVSIKPSKEKLYMQFDLGSPITFFYSGSIAELHRKIAWNYNADSSSATPALLTAGNLEIKKQAFPIKRMGEQKNGKVLIIGTIGTDLLEGKIAAINYPNRTLLLDDVLPASYAAIHWQDLVQARGAILLPSKIRNKPTMLFFDTGSSAFELLTNKATFEQLAVAGAPVTRNEVNSWQHKLTTHTTHTNDSIAIGGATLALNNVTHIEGASQSQLTQMMQMGIGGMTGNKLFLQNILVLDMVRKKFGVLSSK